MEKKIDISKLENPYVQVVWEDTSENFTQERIKSVKHYFQKKYNTNNVNVITKVKRGDDVEQTVDVSFNIMDKNYQHELVKSILKTKQLENMYDMILKLDSAVENKLIETNAEITPFKKWYIRKIEFSNFLSYGENQVIDFEQLGGITAIESDPPNFGGKTVLSVDLLLFLFFNTTTKTTKAEEIFNRFTDKNKVSVKGEISIDGDDYIIVRNVERKLAKSGDWNVKTELDFFKKMSDGQLQNFTGEQRRETEAFIKASIGDIDDFLMTILTTATNLEDLLDAKPTARGQVLSKFLGLEFLKKKETIGKEIYSEFSKGMLSNVYNSEQLKSDIESSKNEISNLERRLSELEGELSDIDKRIDTGKEYRDNLISQKHTDIDNELLRLSPEKIQSELNELGLKLKNTQVEIDSVNVVEPSKFYEENKHDTIKEEISKNYKNKVGVEVELNEVKKLENSVSGGVTCEHCGIELMFADLTQKKIAKKTELEQKISEINEVELNLKKKDDDFNQTKREFDIYEKNKLIKERHELTLERIKLQIDQTESKLAKFNEVQDKIRQNEKIDAQLVKTTIRIDELVSEKNRFYREQVTNQMNIRNLNERIENNIRIIETIELEFEKEKVYKIYLDCYGKNGISKLIMKSMMPLINSELQRLLQDSCYFNLEIRISDKNEVEFWMRDNSTGVEKLMVSGSGYERTIASLALRAVLSKVCSLPKPNIIVFDEVFGKISNDNLEMVGEFFTKIKEYFEKIFVITHNPLVSNWSDKRLKITKRENISYVNQ
jgi:DNA repair exonuclease SbcCD ATPase subunit